MTDIVYNKNGIPFDIDAIATDLNGKADVDLTNCTKPHIVETYVNGTSWYRIYSDGWCEQGGAFTSDDTSVVFLKEFADTNYTVTISANLTGVSSYAYQHLSFIRNKTTTGFGAGNTGYATSNNGWYACGYLN